MVDPNRPHLSDEIWVVIAGFLGARQLARLLLTAKRFSAPLDTSSGLGLVQDAARKRATRRYLEAVADLVGEQDLDAMESSERERFYWSCTALSIGGRLRPARQQRWRPNWLLELRNVQVK